MRAAVMHEPAAGAGDGASRPATITPLPLRAALGRFPTGVTLIVTECADHRVHAMTVNSFTSLSLDPPLVLWALRASSARFATFAHCKRVSVNVLAEHQVELARACARPGDPGVPTASWDAFLAGCPVVGEASAQFVCEPRDVAHYGDHAVVVAEVTAFVESARKPLVFVGGRYYAGSSLMAAQGAG